MDTNSNSDYSDIRRRFLNPPEHYGAYVYYEPDNSEEARNEDAIIQYIKSCKRQNIGCIVPVLCKGRKLEAKDLDEIRDTYGFLLAAARREEIKIAFNLEGEIESLLIAGEAEANEYEMRAKTLTYKEHHCEPLEQVELHIRRDGLMSVVAFDEFNNEAVDLREYIDENEILHWTAPYENWTIIQYFCLPDEEEGYDFANYMNYDASKLFLHNVYSLFWNIFDEYCGDTLTLLTYANICYPSRNRRNFDLTFNEVFERENRFDPVPYYPAMFRDMGKDTFHLKTLFFSCRANMIASGMIKALNDFASEHNMFIMGTAAEPKLSACSWLFGDGMLVNSYSPCALLDKAYLYGMNSIKIAAGAAYNYDLPIIGCEIFRDYNVVDDVIAFKESMNAFSRGANLLLAHSVQDSDPENKQSVFPSARQKNDYFDFVLHCQALLRGGRHVADIALLYPINTLHSKVNLYNAPAEGFEYPDTSETIDYMTLINSISIFSGHDLTVLHPKTLNERCHIKDGRIYLNNESDKECFSVVFLPCTEIVSLANMRMLYDFYISGGKIIATGELPCAAYEYSPDGSEDYDAEVCRLTDLIFGETSRSKAIMRNFVNNKNDNGGEAYYLYFSRTATDGTDMVSGAMIKEALDSFKIPYDIYLPDMPRFECTGALNNNFRAYETLGLDKAIPGGGMLNHIHKIHGETDIYYFSNTTTINYNHFVFLRGFLVPEEWDPHTGRIRRRKCEYIRIHGEIYTKIPLTLYTGESVFLVSDGNKEQREQRDLTDDDVSDIKDYSSLI